MRNSMRGRETGAFTVIELLCVIAIIGLLAALLLPALNQAKARAKRIECVENLHQIGIGFQTFAHDHNGQFPMAVPAASGGSLEFAQNAYMVQGQFYFTFRHFQALSNDLVSPRVLVCPADTRVPAADFGALNNQNLSYFIGLNADFSRPETILAGDRNLTNDYAGPGTLALLGPNFALRWTREMHEFKGNVLYSEGRVAEQNSPGLMAGTLGHGTYNLAMPTVPGGGLDGSSLASKSRAGDSAASAPLPSLASSPTLGVPGGENTTPAPNPPTPSGVSASPRLVEVATSGAADASRFADVTPRAKEPTNASISGGSSPVVPNPDPGFSLFPPWVFGFMQGLMRQGAGWLYLLLVLLVVTSLVARKLTRDKRRGRVGPR